MMFSAGDAYDLWWTGQEFKDMRVEACEQMLNHDGKVRIYNFAQFYGEFLGLQKIPFGEIRHRYRTLSRFVPIGYCKENRS